MSFFEDIGDFFEPVGEYISDFSEWMGKNPVAADFIKGAAGAGLSYYAQKEAQENALQLEQRRYENSLAKAPASNGNYGSHNASLTSGLLSKGVFKKGVSS